jgi:hypothetical protein
MAESTFYIARNDVRPADKLLNQDTLMKAAPDYYGPRFEAIKELRDADDGSLHKGNEFRRVASLVNVPLAYAFTTLLDPEWLKDRSQFYSWLDRNLGFCTYQRPSRGERYAMVQRDIGHIGRTDGTEANQEASPAVGA